MQHQVRLTAGAPALAAAGVPHPPVGSCELSIVDREGNWVQMMNTLQGGGIPGLVVDGVTFCGKELILEMEKSIYRGDKYKFAVRASSL